VVFDSSNFDDLLGEYKQETGSANTMFFADFLKVEKGSTRKVLFLDNELQVKPLYLYSAKLDGNKYPQLFLPDMYDNAPDELDKAIMSKLFPKELISMRAYGAYTVIDMDGESYTSKKDGKKIDRPYTKKLLLIPRKFYKPEDAKEPAQLEKDLADYIKEAGSLRGMAVKLQKGGDNKDPLTLKAYGSPREPYILKSEKEMKKEYDFSYVGEKKSWRHNTEVFDIIANYPRLSAAQKQSLLSKVGGTPMPSGENNPEQSTDDDW
jgi:hypothetical protein